MEKIWKIPNHKRNTAKTAYIQRIPSCNLPSGQNVRTHMSSEKRDVFISVEQSIAGSGPCHLHGPGSWVHEGRTELRVPDTQILDKNIQNCPAAFSKTHSHRRRIGIRPCLIKLGRFDSTIFCCNTNWKTMHLKIILIAKTAILLLNRTGPNCH